MLSTEGPKVDVDDRLQDLHNAPINVNFELGGGWVGGGGGWVKAGDLISKFCFGSNAQGTSLIVIFGGKRTNSPPLQFR